MDVILVLSVCFIMAFWRRLFGGGFFREGILSKRGVQCACYLLFTSVVAYFLLPLPLWWQNLIAALIFAAWTYCQFWSRGHGVSMDEGRDTEPLESTIKRYNERWYHYVCDWLFPNHLYGFLYDAVYMGLRYTCPLIVLWALGFIPVYFGVYGCLFDWRIILIGMFVSPIYMLSWTIYEREEWIFKKYGFLNRAIHLAELLTGFIWGLWVLCLN